jgi:hypothetical protein
MYLFDQITNNAEGKELEIGDKIMGDILFES